MKLRKLALYNTDGDVRVLTFQAGLNIITGASATGKSALLDIVEYCLGRSTLVMPVGPITETVAWYSLTVELPTTTALIARPAPPPGQASSSRAMLEYGADLEPPPLESLVANTDSNTVREQLGRMIGIEENAGEHDTFSLRQPVEANLGHALLLCLQRQNEIANRDLLFHRQGEEGVARAIQDTAPYFLGAVPRDQAIIRQRLTAARRELRGAEQELRVAQAANESMEVQLRSLVTQALAAGLLSEEPARGTQEGVEALRRAAAAAVPDVHQDDSDAVQLAELSRRREELRVQLRDAGEQRALLESLESDEASYEGVTVQQLSRLQSLELLGQENSDSALCPVCGSHLADEDPTIAELRQATEELKRRIGEFDGHRPRRREALDVVLSVTENIRQELRSVDQAIGALRGGMAHSERASALQLHIQGRILQYLDTMEAADDERLQLLVRAAGLRRAEVERLEALLDPDEEREQLTTRLRVIGDDMTRWAQELGLEHSDNVRLDLRRLTVVADTPEGPVPLNRIGSAANWIGYHLVAHLALHKYFREQRRPVPQFIMLDQPTQAYYPSDTTEWSGEPLTDSDRAAVHAMFSLIREVVDSLGSSLQVVVSDHANLPDAWFQEAIVENWRDGRSLIPTDWLEK